MSIKKFHAIALVPLLFVAIAHGDNLSDAFSNGTVSGDLNLHYNAIDNRSAADSGYINSFIGLKYETTAFNGLQLGLAFKNGAELWEKESGDADGATGSLLTEAYLSYSNDDLTIVLGRQEIDLEWVSDFHEALMVTTTAIPNTLLTVGYTQRIATADEDDLSPGFSDIGSNGAYLLDARIEPMEGLSVSPYLMHVSDLFDGYGVMADFDTESGLGASVHFAQTSVDPVGEADGEIFHLELRGAFAAVALAAGYIQTDEEGGAGYLDTLGDNINPLEEGNQIYAVDAKSYYLSAEYTTGQVSLAAIYNSTDYAGSDEKEFNLVVGYDFDNLVENLSLEFVFADINANASSDDYEKYKLLLTYEF